MWGNCSHPELYPMCQYEDSRTETNWPDADQYWPSPPPTNNEPIIPDNTATMRYPPEKTILPDSITQPLPELTRQPWPDSDSTAESWSTEPWPDSTTESWPESESRPWPDSTTEPWPETETQTRGPLPKFPTQSMFDYKGRSTTSPDLYDYTPIKDDDNLSDEHRYDTVPTQSEFDGRGHTIALQDPPDSHNPVKDSNLPDENSYTEDSKKDDNLSENIVP